MDSKDIFAGRSAGILLHITSLPGPHGNGDLGTAAYAFVGQLASAHLKWWQMLPVGPLGYSPSPYSASSAFAGNPLFISLEFLAWEGLLENEDLQPPADMPRDHVDYRAAGHFRERLLRQAFAAFEIRRSEPEVTQHDHFVETNAYWLDDYCLYAALKRHHGGSPWYKWSTDLRAGDESTLARARRELDAEIRFQRFVQFEFDKQWSALRRHCHENGIGLIGDVPLFVEHDSADVWAHAAIFRLDRNGRPPEVAGVPPDYFSRTGQRWGNPIYRWEELRRHGYDWWRDRLRLTLERFDAARLDHFIGFHRCWAIPATAPDASTGEWTPGPGSDFFSAMRHALGQLPFIAEDLGLTTPEVEVLRNTFDLPGMRVLQFAFGDQDDSGENAPDRYPQRCVVYTGTHDNNTTIGWFRDPGAASLAQSPAEIQREREKVLRYLGSDGSEIHWDMIRLAMMSPADTAIIPLQDVLGLGSDARMNHPGTSAGNWEWRYQSADLTRETLERLAGLVTASDRAHQTSPATRHVVRNKWSY